MSDAAIPVIDLAPYFRGGEAEKRRVALQIDEACTEVGFFTIVGHGVPEDQIQKARQATVDFFDPFNRQAPLLTASHLERVELSRITFVSDSWGWLGTRPA